MLLAIDVAAKGLVVLTIASATVVLLRRRSAAARYLVWGMAMSSLLLLPALSGLMPAWQVPVVPASWGLALPSPSPEDETPAPEAPPARAESVAATPRAPGAEKLEPRRAASPRQRARRSTTGDAPVPPASGRQRTEESTARTIAPTPGTGVRQTRGAATEVETRTSHPLRPTLPGKASLPSWPAVLIGIYVLGTCLLIVRLVLAAGRVARMMRRASPVEDGVLLSDFRRVLAQLHIERPVRLLESEETRVPLAWELLRPAIVLPAGTAAWPRPRQRVAMLHELAHVRRRDCQMQLLSHLALALHWFNPLAWFAERRLRIEREHACDDQVLRSGTRASDYADHLLQIARGLLPGSEPGWAAVGMARTTKLEGRVAAILDPENQRRLPDRRITMTAIAIALALLLPLSALQPGALAHPDAPGLGMGVVPPAAQAAEPGIDELIQMRIHGVSTEFIEEVRAAFGRPVTVSELVQMRIYDTTPEFIRGMSDVFPDEDVTIAEVTQMRIHGATIDFIREMKAAFVEPVDIRDITALRIHGATTEYVRTMAELLPDEDLTVQDITSMRIHGISTDRVRGLQAEGFDDLTVRDLVEMRIHGFERWLKRRGGDR